MNGINRDYQKATARLLYRLSLRYCCWRRCSCFMFYIYIFCFFIRL